MKRDDILNMPAGREMDALIAEKVMEHSVRRGVTNWSAKTSETFSEGFTTLAHYSTDISAAWEVVERLECYLFKMTVIGNDMLSGFTPEYKKAHRYSVIIDESFVVYSSTAPLAICRAALLSVMGD